ncbi:N-acetylgalactosaminyltransferase 7-like isoform X1 [Haliotis rubra]|uniref:N-acetylgalactosaminyltransferase 7-like isoform X1 n=1 Tax=Haliotis rubra TaxID=36100 RepID=UPI001EE52F1D|nr:N-acetylgalactosaminyltransferase 7-like isoform X1 [Haliotis rubra]
MLYRCLRRRGGFRVLSLLGMIMFFAFTSVSIFKVLDDSYMHEGKRQLLNKILMKKKFDPLQPPPKPDSEGKADGGEMEPTWTKKPYSPNAVYKPGVRGNYEPTLDMNRKGPGEYGVPVPTDPNEKDLIEKTAREFGFNMVNSDKISLDRVLKDIRQEECKYWHYPEKLPTASVILVFHNEGWSTFVRTVHSVINMSPPQLLKEVVLVDDGSDKEHLKSRLEDHMRQFGDKVKIVRNSDREGLIQARTIGARAASGDVVIFLDAHCECSPNWLPPLLTRIAYDRTIMAAPVVDGIDWTSYEYRSSYNSKHHRGGFEWGFFYKEDPVPQKELDKRQHDTEPYWSATNAGGLFAIDRKFFFELGAYDPNLKIWGGENFELAFKVWQCGGSSEWVPCSRVGHIYRHYTPARKSNIKTKLSPTHINYIRVVEVWMDGIFSEYFYRREPQLRGYPVNITKELKFRKDNHCRSFQWFIDNVAYDIYNRFPPPAPNKAWGRINSRKSNGTSCLEFTSVHNGKSALGSYPCSGANAIFRLNTKGQIGNGERCLLALDDGAVTLEWCSTTDLSGPWDWDKTSGRIYNKSRNKCLFLNPNGSVVLKECNDNEMEQKWDITEFYAWK